MPHGCPNPVARKGIVRGARSHTHVYIRDPDTGDEAYDTVEDPLELRNLYQTEDRLPRDINTLAAAMDQWEAKCRGAP